jgi:hypothetical protein
MRSRYNFDFLFIHSNTIADETRRTLKPQIMNARKIFTFLDKHFSMLEKKKKTHATNVKMMITARFINNMFSALLLTERGLLLDAFNSIRSGIEATAFYWLVCKDETTASLYDAEKSPRPVDIRKRLEALGVDIETLHSLYDVTSTIAHVGNPYDQIQIRWEQGSDGKLLIGGGRSPDVQNALLEDMLRAVLWFVRFDENYVITEGKGFPEIISSQ